MPSRNVIKTYIENGFYHIYNRGFEKRKIFLDKNDYLVFTHFMRRSLDKELKVNPDGIVNMHSIADEADLVCYCLMPNHFHFLIKQNTKVAVTKFLRRVLTSYVMYFNKRYQREGSLFQGKPRGVSVKNESYLLHLSKYIHLNPFELDPNKPLESYLYSSYPVYLNKKSRSWIRSSEILGFFKSARAVSLKDFVSYQNFVENHNRNPRDILGELALD